MIDKVCNTKTIIAPPAAVPPFPTGKGNRRLEGRISEQVYYLQTIPPQTVENNLGYIHRIFGLILLL